MVRGVETTLTRQRQNLTDGWELELTGESHREETEVTAFIPCFNNESTLRKAVESVVNQSLEVNEILVVDDGSGDGSTETISDLDVPILRNEQNEGRGAARARAMREAGGELVLCCDATSTLAPDFLENGLSLFEDPQVGGVVGTFCSRDRTSVSARWRARHLFKEGIKFQRSDRAPLATGGAILRRSAVLEVGNFNEALRHSEDADLGRRLALAGFKIVKIPECVVYYDVKNTLSEVLERYSRWYIGAEGTYSIKRYMKEIIYSIRVMASIDFAEGDWACALVSLFSPHYRFWKAVYGRGSIS